jgi:ABC-2 type transport system ATP-binding protein
MDEAEKCDNLALIREGKLIAKGTPEQLKKSTLSTTLEQVFLHYVGEEV